MGTIHRISIGEEIAVYKSDGEMEFSNIFDENVPRAYGTTSVTRGYGTTEEGVFFLMHLYVPPSQRGVGVGTLLLKRIVLECKKMGVERIELDDMTGRVGETRNIYLKMGFLYVEEGKPEMYMSLP
jgi:GNAT superfamily N-acetyltransferase